MQRKIEWLPLMRDSSRSSEQRVFLPLFSARRKTNARCYGLHIPHRKQYHDRDRVVPFITAITSIGQLIVLLANSNADPGERSKYKTIYQEIACCIKT